MSRHQKAVPVVHDVVDPGLQALRSMRKTSVHRELIDPMIRAFELSQSSAKLEHQRQTLLNSTAPDHRAINRIDGNMELLRGQMNQELLKAWQVYDLYYRPFGMP